MRTSSFVICGFLFLHSLHPQSTAYGQFVEFHGQASGWAGFHDALTAEGFAGLRYLPTVFLKSSAEEQSPLGVEIAGNASGSFRFSSGQAATSDYQFRFYRLWARYSTPQLEVRAGLQRISFGSATLFRPLMWFDSIDPRDPLQLTDGVYALLARYFFLDNANIWLWGVYGQDELKGWEVIPSKNRSAEYGGRLQLPVFSGEAALTFHRRTVEVPALSDGMPLPRNSTVPEYRAGADGKWDIGPGVWFEGTMTHQETSLIPAPWQRALTIGADYTFGLGTGLNVLAEVFSQTGSREAFSSGPSIEIAALSANYRFTLLDNLSGILYVDLQHSDLYAFLNWRRTYDTWTFYLIGFWNPSAPLSVLPSRQLGVLNGRGFQVIAVFDH
jgi:hypothetical protein